MQADVSRLVRWLPMRHQMRRTMALICKAGIVAPAVLSLFACKPTPPPPPKEQPRWPTLPLAPVPEFMHGTVYERIRLTNIDPFQVGAYSLAVNLHNTGDSTASTAVREYVKKMILVHQFSSLNNPEYSKMSPDDILKDKRVAIVTVQGQIPVGARAGQKFDVSVNALPRSYTTSIAHGIVYQADLAEHGLENPTATGARVLASVSGGEVFVNPVYALSESGNDLRAAKASLRTGTILNGGVVIMDRPIFLQLREPQNSTSRLIEATIQHRWQDKSVASAEDEGVVQVFVPLEYKGDWKHFSGVMTHLFLNDSADFLIRKAKELVTVAHQANVPLADVSYCWEAMGEDALPIYTPLISDPNPDVAFAAARAAAFLGDLGAKHALLQMAHDSKNQNQLAAVQTLGALPNSPATNQMLRTLLDAESADVRIEAYRILARDGLGVFSKKVGDRFFLDIVESRGKPMIYASRTGVPRIAVFGRDLTLQTPITFTAMDTRFSISSSDGTKLLTMFYRDPRQADPINVLTHNDLPEIIARLGGEGPDSNDTFDFSYNDVVAITQQMVEQHNVVGEGLHGEQLATAFVLEHPAVATSNLPTIPLESPAGRPSGKGVDSPPVPAADPKAPAENTGPRAAQD